MNRFKIIPIFFFMIQAILAAGAFALNAPYLTSATPTNGHSIALTWRNNDFDATQVLVLRKTATTEWVLKDSVAGTVTSYTDSSLQPLTEYSFALLASAPGELSDTSNVLTATTLKESEIFAAPGITVVWIEGQKFFGIRFFDSSNTEKGFRLYRKDLIEPWDSIDSIVTQAPDTAGWKSFADSAITDNKWYSYKVQVYNDSQEIFSPETTVYNYVPPKKTKSYVMTKRGSIPAMPISWVERIGDSLYFPEVAAPGDTEISVINVSNSSAPLFKGYVDPKNMPAWLNGSVVEARVTIPSTGKLFAHRNGYYIVSHDSTIYQYDSATLTVHDSIIVSPGLSVYLYDVSSLDFSLIGWLNDSCSLVEMTFWTGSGDMHHVWPLHFNAGGIDTFPRSMSWIRITVNGEADWSQTTWGCINNIAVYRSSWVYLRSYSQSDTYIFQDFSNSFTKPLTFSETVSAPLFSIGQSPVIDTSVVFTSTKINVFDISKGYAFYAFNITDAHSGPSASFLGKIADSSYKGGPVKEILVDENRKSLYVIGDSGISIYTYLIGPPAGVRNPSISRNSPLKRISVTQCSRGVSFSIIGAKMKSLQILNSKGQIIRSANIPASETFVWNRRDNSGTAVPVGFYIYKIGTLKDGIVAGSMVLAR
jgi:hypothetical protein